MAYNGYEIFYRGNTRGIKEITQLDGYLLVKFNTGKVISYDLDMPKVIFEEDKDGKSKQ